MDEIFPKYITCNALVNSIILGLSFCVLNCFAILTGFIVSHTKIPISV